MATLQKTFDLTLPLKGGRSYVRSSDIYQQLLQQVASLGLVDIKNIDLRFYRFAKANLSTYLTDEIPTGYDAERVAAMTFHCEAQKYFLSLRENGKPIQEYQEYNEEKLIESIVLSANRRVASVTGVPEFSPMEKIIALGKKLEREAFGPDTRSYFAQIQLRTPLKETICQLQLELIRSSNGKRTKFAILEDGLELGFLLTS